MYNKLRYDSMPSPLTSPSCSNTGIFERDVEIGNQQQRENPEEFELTVWHEHSNAVVPNPRDTGIFPKEVLTALEHDGDAIAQAAMQWEHGYLAPIDCASVDSNQSICRICHSGESSERLLNPCKCDGSVKWIHQTCLLKWLRECGMANCELCGEGYKFKWIGSRNMLRVSLTIKFILQSLGYRSMPRDIDADLFLKPIDTILCSSMLTFF